MKARVHVTLKREVLDPQGDAVRRALVSLGFSGVRDVRVGKLVEIEMDGADHARAEQDLRAMCEKLLANAIIEEFDFEILR